MSRSNHSALATLLGLLVLGGAAVAADQSPTERALEVSSANYLSSLVDPGATTRDIEIAWEAFKFDSSVALAQRSKRVVENPACWAPHALGARKNLPGRTVYVRECLKLDPFAILQGGRYVR